MASEVTRLTDVIVPEVFARYLIEDSVKKSALYKSGILITDEKINGFLAGGGSTFNMPFFQRLSGEPQAIQSDTTIETKKVSTSKMVARRLMFGRGWASEELAAALSGSNPMEAIKSMVTDYWNNFMQKCLISTIKGVIADNIENDSGDLVKDITTPATPAAKNKISASAVIQTASLFGDKSNILSAIAMHSVVHATLQEANLISYVPTNVQDLGWGTYLNKSVIVDDGLTPDTDGANKEYWTILFKPGSIAFGESGQGITTVETGRNAAKSEDQLFTRRQFCMHPQGFKWVENSVADDMPTRSEIEEAGNWDRVMEKKNCGFAVLLSNG